ncbi:putative O-glycosylation ligase, exosortase A system-associated [Vibrio sp. PNB22_1_1]
MRDLVFIIFFAIILFISFRKPFIAVSIWLWSGIFVPIYWLYGFAEAIRYNVIFSGSAIIAYAFYKQKPSVHFDSLFFLVLIFFLHTTITTSMTLIPPSVSWIIWDNFFKVILLFIFIYLTVRNINHFNLLIWIIALSIGFFALVEGLKFIKSGGFHQVHGAYGHILGDNNHMALAILMAIPLLIYLISYTPEKWLRIGLIGLIFVCVLAVLGTKSRGGFIGLLIVGAYFWVKSEKKLLATVGFAALSFIAIDLLPDKWFERMETIQTAESDGSFATRLVSWKIHTLMALERPLIGGGFRAPQYGYIWRDLAYDFDKLSFIRSAPPGDKGWAAHSIYFQVLGDHGFVGLFLFLMIIILAFLKLSSIEKYFKGHWQSKLARMIKVSLTAYCVSGAAVSMAYFELFYVLLAMIICLSTLKKESQMQINTERITAL